MIYFSEKFMLRQSDFDCNDNMKASSYLDLFQTVASEHATREGLGFEEMKRKNLAWVITKMRFEVLLPLVAGEIVSVETAPQPKGSVDYTRDYYIFKADGSLAVKGSSQWVLIDFTARKIVRPCVEFVGEFIDKRAYEGRLPKVNAVDDIFLGSHKVAKLDLDHNGHVNNIRYADMVFELETREFTSPIRAFAVNFSKESYEGETLDIYTDGNGLYTGKKTDGTVSFTMFIER